MYNTLSQPRFFVLSHNPAAKYWYSRDAVRSTQPQYVLERYIQDANTIFIKNTSFLGDFKKTFTTDDENHLKQMLELLIDARKVWEDEFR